MTGDGRARGSVRGRHRGPGPLATPTSGMSSRPTSARTCWATASCPAPPSMRTRSGRSGNMGSGSVPSALGAAWSGRSLSFREAFEAARQHFAHHGVVVAGRGVGRLDVELAVGAFDEALGPRDDHGADRIRAGDVAVVINLDPARAFRQSETFLHAFEKPCLR